MSTSHHYTHSPYGRSHAPYDAGAGGRSGTVGKKNVRLASIVGRDTSANVASSSRATSVVVDGLVLLQMIKNGNDYYPYSLQGFLAGMETTSGVIEVTNSFPVIESSSSEDGTSGSSEDRAFEDLVPAYQHFCKSSGLDFNHVGYYVIAYLDNFYSKSFVDSMASRQAKNPHIVFLIYDPIATCKGHISLKAMRLTDNFMELYKGRKQFDGSSYIPSTNLFEEIPIKIRNSHLIQALLADLVDAKALVPEVKPAGLNDPYGVCPNHKNVISSNFERKAVIPAHEFETSLLRLDLSITPFLEEHLKVLNDLNVAYIDNVRNSNKFKRDMQIHSYKLDIANNRTSEGQEQALKDLLASKSDDSFDTMVNISVNVSKTSKISANVGKFSKQSFGKLFLASSLATKE